MTANKTLYKPETIKKQTLLNSLLVIRRALNILIADVIESSENNIKKDDVRKHYLFLIKTLLWKK